MMIYLLILGLALAARLGYRHWQWWVALIIVSTLVGISSHSTVAVYGVALLGLIAPELWQGLRRILSHPRTVIYLIIGGAVVLGMTNKAAGHMLSSLASGVAIIAIIFLALRTMLRGLTGGGRRH